MRLFAARTSAATPQNSLPWDFSGPYVQKEVSKLAKQSGHYETVMVLNTKLGEEALQALVEKFKALIEQNGTINNVDVWGKRRLAYLIEDETEGYYVLVDFTSKPDFPAELDRVYKITDGVLRSLITAKQD